MFVTCIVEERGDEDEVLIVPALCFLSVFPSSFHAMRPTSLQGLQHAHPLRGGMYHGV